VNGLKEALQIGTGNAVRKIAVSSIHTPALRYGGIYERNSNPPYSPFTKRGNPSKVLPFVKGRQREFT
jgi:hypothetical protein